MEKEAMTSNTKARYYIRDPRQQSLQGRPEGGWLKEPPPASAVWVNRREQARSFTMEEIEALKKVWSYIEGCEMFTVRVGGGGQ
jgi:hypothetical protein